MNSIKGAIIGDIAGSALEGTKWKGPTFEEATCVGYFPELPDWDRHVPKEITGMIASEFPLTGFSTTCYTDDTVLTCAIFHWLCSAYNYENMDHEDEKTKLALFLKLYGKTFPNCGFGKMFIEWCHNFDMEVSGKSYGNGAAMRISPLVDFYENERQLLRAVEVSAKVTHRSPHSVAGAKALALAGFLAKTLKRDQEVEAILDEGEGEERIIFGSKETIKKRIEEDYHYDLDKTIDEYRQTNKRFTSRAEDTVPIAIRAFLEGRDFEDIIRRAISVGGDTDTLAAMAGTIAGPFYGIDDDLWDECEKFLDHNLKVVLGQSKEMYCEA